MYFFLKSMTRTERFLREKLHIFFVKKSLTFRSHLFTCSLVIFCFSVKNPKGAYAGAERLFSYFYLLVVVIISQRSVVCCIFINTSSIQEYLVMTVVDSIK